MGRVIFKFVGPRRPGKAWGSWDVAERSGNRQLPIARDPRFIRERTLCPPRPDFPRDLDQVGEARRQDCGFVAGASLAKVAELETSINRMPGYCPSCRCNSLTNVVKPVRTFALEPLGLSESTAPRQNASSIS